MSLQNLPVELILDIADYLGPHSLCSWIRTCRRYRSILGGETLCRRASRLDLEYYGWPWYLSKTVWTGNMSAFLAILKRTTATNINSQRAKYELLLSMLSPVWSK